MNPLTAVMLLLLLIPFATGCGSAKAPDQVPDVREAVTKEPPIAKKEEPLAVKGKPDRPPEFFGIVEQVKIRSSRDRPEFETVLIKLHPSVEGRPKPSSSDGPELLWLYLPKTTVERRNGPIAVGQVAWVWHKDVFYDTDPLIIYPEYVVTASEASK